MYPGHALVMLGAQRQRVEITGPAPHAYAGADVMDMDAERAADGAWKLCNSAHVFASGHLAKPIKKGPTAGFSSMPRQPFA